jgi:NAD dependent epimerase/dehydratase family enzyme
MATPLRIVVAGASGFIGRYLVESFRTDGFQVTTIGRTDADAAWGDAAAIASLVDGADVVLNLAGRSVNARYGAARRAEILHSRLNTTRQLHAAIERAEHPPRVWLNASTATIYRHAFDHPQTESTGELGEGFSVDVARAWEGAFFEGDLPGTRRVALRMAIVLGHGSALVPLIALARVGFGGPQYDGRWFGTPGRRAAGVFHERRATHGRQMFSWVHVRDVERSIRFLIEHDELDGPVNVVSPHPVDNRTLMRIIRRAVTMPVGLPLFRWMTELGALAIRTESELLLKSRWVLPERLTQAGYEFEQPDLDAAVRDIVGTD